MCTREVPFRMLHFFHNKFIMKTYIKLVIGTLCLVFLFSGTSYIQAATKDKNFNNDVYRLQKILATDSAIYPEGKVTGVFDSKTYDAIVRFQILVGNVYGFDVGFARQKGTEAKIKSEINMLRASGEIYYDGNSNSYKGFCKSKDVGVRNNELKQYKSTITCSDNVSSYQLNANLSGTKDYYCADSTGFAGTLSKKPKKGSLACQ